MTLGVGASRKARGSIGWWPMDWLAPGRLFWRPLLRGWWNGALDGVRARQLEWLVVVAETHRLAVEQRIARRLVVDGDLERSTTVAEFEAQPLQLAGQAR